MKSTNKGRSASDKGSRASLLARLITWFDSYVELYTVDPLKVDRQLKGYEGTDIDQLWKSVRRDVEKINELPEGSEKIGKYVRNSSIARNISLLLTVATFGFLLFFLYFQSQLESLGGTIILIAAPGVVIAVMYAALMFNTISTRRLNKAMRAFYDENAQELRKQTSHMREATQQLIDKLQREIYSHNYDQDKFKFELYHSNYRNIVIVGNRRGRSVATVKPKVKSQTE